jgi:hypothetical protein
MKKLTLITIMAIAIFLLLPKQSYAFNTAADTITTSRPSAATPLSANAITTDSSVSVVAGTANLSTFLASDSAVLWGGTPETRIVATASADRTKLYFTGELTGNHSLGSVVTSAVTAKHTITFKLNQEAAVGDILRVTFPGSANTSASPSASTFAFNNLQTANVTVSSTTGVCGTIAVSAPSIQCTVSTIIPTTATVTITIGATTPALINPTKTNAIGTSDLWKIALAHTNSGGADVESAANVAIATAESVYVQGIVDASITMAISGIGTGYDISGISALCPAITTNSGFASTSTLVNLGTIGTSINYAAQRITISTNGVNGYALTATSSGRLMNPANGYFFPNAQVGGNHLTANDTPAPQALSGLSEAFGITSCGADAVSPIVFTQGTLFGNPSNSAGNAFNYKLSGETSPTDPTDTVVLYGARARATTPAGAYSTILSYVATATF